MIVGQFPDRTIEVNGTTYLYFGGTSYLGMATHPRFQQLLFDSIKIWGSAYGSSRNSNIKLSVYEEAEALLAKIIGAEAALTVSSGTLAGKLVLAYLNKRYDGFFHYPKTHPAVVNTSSFPLLVDGKLHQRLTDGISETIVISVDAVLSLEVRPTKFDFLEDISPAKKVILLIDESHSLGIVGSRGQGIFSSINHPRIAQKIMVSSLTKAYGCSGGVITGHSDFINELKDDPMFVSASGMNPVFLQAFISGQQLIQERFNLLKSNLRFLFKTEEITKPFYYDANYPVIYCHSNGVFEYLKSKGIIITNFKYPNYDILMNRIVISANHTKADLERLQSALVEFQKETLH